MARMIDAYQAIDIIDEWLDSVGTVMVGKGLSSYGELIGCIEEAPTLTQPNEPLTLVELREMDRKGGSTFCPTSLPRLLSTYSSTAQHGEEVATFQRRILPPHRRPVLDRPWPHGQDGGCSIFTRTSTTAQAPGIVSVHCRSLG